jgi:hypothetical protein
MKLKTIPVDCACLIHGNAYDWTYVDRLYAMLSRNFTDEVRLHVFTEEHRTVPEHLIKHSLEDWPGIHGPKRAWWYKMQMFNNQHFQGRLLYFDLDVVITGNLDWIQQLSPKYFWTIHDFKYLWRPEWAGLNSSIMYWDTTRFNKIYQEFTRHPIDVLVRKHPGDQDYLTSVLDPAEIQFFEQDRVKSWRWQIKDGGMDMRTRKYNRPGAGSVLSPNTQVVIFHGKPKPHEVLDNLVAQHWRL